MKKILAVLALLLVGSSNVWAGCPEVVGTTTRMSCTMTVFNDSGSALTSGAVVIWDNDDTEYDRSGYPYVTTTTATDSDYPAGVLIDGSCADQSLCQMVYYGWARTNVANSTDVVAEDTQVSTSSVSGQAGDWGGGANTCSLGMLLEAYNLDTGGSATAADLVPMPVWVNPGCED